MHESSQSKENNPNKRMYTIIIIILSLNLLMKLMFHQLAKYCYILLISQVKLRIWSNSSSKMSYDSYVDGNSRVEDHVWLITRRPKPSRELKVMVIS